MLHADPLADIANTAAIAGVAAGGNWRSELQLKALVAAAKKQLNPTANAGAGPR
jgi:hypothetical protein